MADLRLASSSRRSSLDVVWGHRHDPDLYPASTAHTTRRIRYYAVPVGLVRPPFLMALASVRRID